MHVQLVNDNLKQTSYKGLHVFAVSDKTGNSRNLVLNDLRSCKQFLNVSGRWKVNTGRERGFGSR